MITTSFVRIYHVLKKITEISVKERVRKKNNSTCILIIILKYCCIAAASGETVCYSCSDCATVNSDTDHRLCKTSCETVIACYGKFHSSVVGYLL